MPIDHILTLTLITATERRIVTVEGWPKLTRRLAREMVYKTFGRGASATVTDGRTTYRITRLITRKLS